MIKNSILMKGGVGVYNTIAALPQNQMIISKADSPAFRLSQNIIPELIVNEDIKNDSELTDLVLNCIENNKEYQQELITVAAELSSRVTTQLSIVRNNVRDVVNSLLPEVTQRVEFKMGGHTEELLCIETLKLPPILSKSKVAIELSDIKSNDGHVLEKKPEAYPLLEGSVLLSVISESFGEDIYNETLNFIDCTKITLEEAYFNLTGVGIVESSNENYVNHYNIPRKTAVNILSFLLAIALRDNVPSGVRCGLDEHRLMMNVARRWFGISLNKLLRSYEYNDVNDVLYYGKEKSRIILNDGVYQRHLKRTDYFNVDLVIGAYLTASGSADVVNVMNGLLSNYQESRYNRMIEKARLYHNNNNLVARAKYAEALVTAVQLTLKKHINGDDNIPTEEYHERLSSALKRTRYKDGTSIECYLRYIVADTLFSHVDALRIVKAMESYDLPPREAAVNVKRDLLIDYIMSSLDIELI